MQGVRTFLKKNFGGDAGDSSGTIVRIRLGSINHFDGKPDVYNLKTQTFSKSKTLREIFLEQRWTSELRLRTSFRIASRGMEFEDFEFSQCFVQQGSGSKPQSQRTNLKIDGDQFIEIVKDSKCWSMTLEELKCEDQDIFIFEGPLNDGEWASSKAWRYDEVDIGTVGLALDKYKCWNHMQVVKRKFSQGERQYLVHWIGCQSWLDEWIPESCLRQRMAPISRYMDDEEVDLKWYAQKVAVSVKAEKNALIGQPLEQLKEPAHEPPLCIPLNQDNKSHWMPHSFVEESKIHPALGELLSVQKQLQSSILNFSKSCSIMDHKSSEDRAQIRALKEAVKHLDELNQCSQCSIKNLESENESLSLELETATAENQKLKLENSRLSRQLERISANAARQKAADRANQLNRECRICFNEIKDWGLIFSPCGHIVACINCQEELMNYQECVDCRTKSDGVHRVFLKNFIG